MNKNNIDLLKAYMNLTNSGISVLDHILRGIPKENPPKYTSLGKGYELRPIEMTDSEGNPVDNDSKYSHLYHNGLKVSDTVFRKGGMGGTFSDGYCELIKYETIGNANDFDSGTFVIINELGDVSLKSEEYSSGTPHHIGGNLASLGDHYYDLRTGIPIAPKTSSSIVGEDFLIFEHRYSWYNKKVTIDLGIYLIDFKTCKIEKIGNTRK